MRLIDAEKLETDLKKYIKVQEDTAKEYNMADGTYIKLQRAIVLTIMEMVQAQPEIGGDNNAG